MSLPTSGIHDGIPETAYHADGRSLSSTGAKTIYSKGAAYWRWEQDHPKSPSDVLDFGTVVHKLVLGAGPEIVVVDAADWRSKTAKDARDTAREAGAVPILAHKHEVALDMAEAVDDNPTARTLLSGGEPEQSLYATDPETGVLMRGRIDYLSPDGFVDVKTSGNPVDPSAFARSAWDFGYFQQVAWYQDLLALNGLDQMTPYWVAVVKDPPHDVYVLRPNDESIDLGRFRNRSALRTYADALESGYWPPLADPTAIHTVSAPPWAR